MVAVTDGFRYPSNGGKSKDRVKNALVGWVKSMGKEDIYKHAGQHNITKGKFSSALKLKSNNLM